MIHLYFKLPPTQDRYFPGDRYLINIARKLFRKPRTSGVKKVFDNLCLGFNQLKIPYKVNQPFKNIAADDAVIVLGVGRYGLQGYGKPNKIIAGIGLMTHPAEWPDLMKQYPVAKYLQHSNWANNVYAAYYGRKHCAVWPAGIDTDRWMPAATPPKFDILIYNKVMWGKAGSEAILKQPILNKLNALGLSYSEITYGHYAEAEYQTMLQDCRAMIFLCEHESQGFACCEALASNVPILAWDQGYWLDPNRFTWNDPMVKATSIPYFDERCGDSFIGAEDFEKKFKAFWPKVLQAQYQPRAFILDNLTLKKSAERMLSIIAEVYSSPTTP